MIKKAYKKGVKHLFYWWIEKDLRRYLKMIENKSLKETVENKGSPIMEDEGSNSSRASLIKDNVWNYGTFLAINTYHEGVQRELSGTITQEAETVVSELVEEFIRCLDGKSLPVEGLFPNPHYNFEKATDEVSATREEEIMDLLNNQFKRAIANFDIEKMTHIFQREKTLRVVAKTLVKEYFPTNKKSLVPGSKHYGVLIWHLLYQAANDIRLFSNKHNVHFINDGEIRCFYNVLNLYLHYIAVNGKAMMSIEDREVMFAASALHPIQDDIIDEEEATQASKDAIGAKLRGEAVPSLNNKVDVVLNLIDVIYRKYPVREHPDLVEIFIKLHEYQCISESQKSGNISNNDLLSISFMKGGYAFAFFGYVVLGEMSLKQFNHFFVMGAIFQILDDFHDIHDDLDADSLTIWTRYINENRLIDPVFNAVIGIQHYYEKYTSLNKEFKHPVFIRRIELIGIRYDAFRFYTMNQKYFSPEYRDIIKQCFPFKVDIPERFFNNSRKYETLDLFISILETTKEMLIGKEKK